MEILSNGEVGEIIVLKCQPKGYGFEEAAINAVKKWKFEPAKDIQTEEPISTKVTFSVDFSMK